MKSKKSFNKKSSSTPMSSGNDRNGLRPVKKSKSGKSKNHLSIYDDYDEDFDDIPDDYLGDNYYDEDEEEE